MTTTTTTPISSSSSTSSFPVTYPIQNPNINQDQFSSFLTDSLNMALSTSSPSSNSPQSPPQTLTLTLDPPSTLHKPQLLPNASSPPPTLLHISFNQDAACFAAGTDRGFLIFNCDPFRQVFRREFDSGGIGAVQMLFRCNIQGLLGGGDQPQYPLNKVMIWDDNQGRCIGELSFRSEVKSVRLRRDRIVVVLMQKVFVYNFADLKLLHQIETFANPKGLCEVSHGSGSMVLVCPGLQKGQVRVENYTCRKTKFITAHGSRIVCLSLTNDGRLLATASSKGTLIRIYNALDGSLLQEVRRGADRADIYSLAFSSTAQWLAVSSDKGTIHVFSLKDETGQSGPLERSINNASEHNSSNSSPGSHLSFIKGVLPKYFSSEWSVAQFRLREGCHYIVAFGHQKNTVIILGMDGSFYRCQFDPVAGGEMTELECHNFLKQEEPF